MLPCVDDDDNIINIQLQYDPNGPTEPIYEMEVSILSPFTNPLNI